MIIETVFPAARTLIPDEVSTARAPTRRVGFTRRGLSLLELIIAVALLAIAVLFIVSIIPSGVLGLKKAEDLQTASAYGMELIETVRMHPPAAPDRRSFALTLNSTNFDFVREIYAVEDDLFDVVVVVTGNPDNPPYRIATRIHATLEAP